MFFTELGGGANFPSPSSVRRFWFPILNSSFTPPQFEAKAEAFPLLIEAGERADHNRRNARRVKGLAEYPGCDAFRGMILDFE